METQASWRVRYYWKAMKPDMRPHTLEGAEVPDAPAESGRLVFVTMAIHMFLMYNHYMSST